MSVLIPRNQRRRLDELTDRVDLDDGDRRAKRSAFWTMLTLSGLIATAGVAGDSTAAVIGAMIIAPLATPIQGIGCGIVTGRASLVGRSLLYVAASVVVVVGIGWVFAHLLPDPGSVLSNSQVLGRTSPTLTDLLAAVATGFAGAVAITRRDVGDVLPGVAIAISLVPPLAVTGVCLGSGRADLAFGSMILFVSNVVVLIIASVIVLTAAGYLRESSEAARTSWRTRAYVALASALILVGVPMAVNTLTSVWAGQARTLAESWLGDSPNAEVDGVSWHGHRIVIDVRSPDELPDVAELQRSLNALLPTDPDVVVVHTVGERLHGSR